jgi:polyhydroxybutyrate depolymerase
MERKRTIMTVLAIGLALPLCACAHGDPAPPGSSDALLRGEIEHAGRQRSYVFYAPAGEGPFPLLVALHGRFGDGKGQEGLSGLVRVAARERFIAVFPDGYRRSWNDARHVGPAADEGIDDVGFLSALIDEFVAHHHADLRRVYAAGMSNGAMMALTLACRIPEKLAGAVAVAGLWTKRSACSPSRPISVALIAGEEDPLVPYDGGEVARDRGAVYSAKETLELFRRVDGCRTPEAERPLPDADPDDGTRARVTGWTGCAEGAEVRLYSVKGGGHTWPGGWQYLGERWVGRTSRDFSASEELWRFLSRHHR